MGPPDRLRVSPRRRCHPRLRNVLQRRGICLVSRDRASSWRSRSRCGMPQFLPAVPLLAVAVFYESGRGIIVETTFAVIVVLAARTGSMRRTVVTLGVCLVCFVARLHLCPRHTSRRRRIPHPIRWSAISSADWPIRSTRQSTLPTHLAMFQNGFRTGLWIRSATGSRRQLWRARPSAARKRTRPPRSTSRMSSSRSARLADLHISLLSCSCSARRCGSRCNAGMPSRWQRWERSSSCLGQWLNGGYYAVSPLVWLTAGFVVASELKTR